MVFIGHETAFAGFQDLDFPPVLMCCNLTMFCIQFGQRIRKIRKKMSETTVDILQIFGNMPLFAPTAGRLAAGVAYQSPSLRMIGLSMTGSSLDAYPLDLTHLPIHISELGQRKLPRTHDVQLEAHAQAELQSQAQKQPGILFGHSPRWKDEFR